MSDLPRKRRKRGPYQKIESQTILAAATNVIRRGYQIERAATAAQIKPATLRSAVRRYRLRGTVLPMKRGRKAKGEFNADVVRFIFDWVDEHEHTTVYDIMNAMDADALLEGVKPAKTTLHRWLRDNALLTFKYSQRSFPPTPSYQQEEDAANKAFDNVFRSVDFHMYENCIYVGEAA